MNLDALQEITRPVEIEGDTENFAAAAFQRAVAALPDLIDEGALTEFASFLECEAAEMRRQASYYASMVPYYGESVAASRQYEAIAFDTMRESLLEQLPS